MKIPKKFYVGAVVALAAAVSISVATADSATNTASCDPNPTITQNTDGSYGFDSHCDIALKPVVGPTSTVTATATVTQTVTASPSASTTAPPTVTPTPTPTPTTTLPASGFPDASNTGPTSSNLTVISGGTIRSNLSGVDITGSAVLAPGVSLTNFKLECKNENAWCLNLQGNNAVSNGEISSPTGLPTGILSYAAGSTVDRVNIHGTGDGLRADGGLIITNSWIHDLYMVGSGHADGSQSTDSANKNALVFRHNTIEGGNNDVIFLQNFGSKVTVDNNKIIGRTAGGNETSYGVAVYEAGQGVTVTNNVFAGTFQVGPVYYKTGVAHSGNTYNGTALD